MRRDLWLIKLLLLCCLLIMGCPDTFSQTGACIFKDTLLKIDFGNSRNAQEFNLRSLKDYNRDYTNCPGDGYYSYSTETSECFNGDWITLTQDHTANDAGGKMFFVNAYEFGAADFFIATLAGFKPNTNYEFAVWMMNLCKMNGGCTPLPPTIMITLETTSGQRIASFQTGLVSSTPSPNWKKYFAFFTTPADVGNILLRMRDNTNGGCGNDFVMDDITLRECYKPEPAVAVAKEIKPAIVVPKPVVKETKPAEPLKKDMLDVTKLPVNDNVKAPQQITKIKPVNIPLPNVLITRENPVVKKIETPATEMLIELYDNGQIDGDTVSIYHNNELIVSHAALSEKPIGFKIKIDANAPHHELIMVADNLGSIPPNTSLMVITAKGKRYEVFISSSEQKNAKLLIDLKE